MRLYWLRKLRRISYKTGFQIPPNTCGKGITIWHWGPIIINGAAQIGENCTLYPGVLTKDIPANSVVVMDNRQLRYLK